MNVNLLDAFERQVCAFPDRIAIVFREEQLTLCLLDSLAEKLAAQLLKQGVKAEDVVGISLEKSVELVVSILAILRIGAIYVPIDPQYPINRIHQIVKATSSKLILGKEEAILKIEDTIKFFPIRLNEIMACNVTNPSPSRPKYEHNFSIIYTSGSTGEPKSVLCNTKSVMNRLGWASRTLGYGPSDICFFQAKYSFVDHIAELFFPLLNGARLIIIEDNYFQEIETYSKNLGTFLVNRLYLTPSFLSLLLEFSDIAIHLSHVKILEVSGEVFKDELYKKAIDLVPKLKVLDRYGSSEATSVIYTYISINEDDKVARSSQVIDNTELFVLDVQLNQVKDGEVGELYISGLSISDGYYRNPVNTALKFLPNPYNSNTNYRLYKTGDRVQYTRGHYKFLGRTDSQIKLRGFRIDLCEIEAALMKQKDVKNTVAIYRDGSVVAFVVTNKLYDVNSYFLMECLSKILPDYMLPSRIQFLDILPMNSHGKLDRKILQEMHIIDTNEFSSETQNHDSVVEAQLCKILCSLLSLKTVLPEDNFFRIGGDSLLAIQAMMRIKKVFGVNLPILTIFKYPVVEQLCLQIENSKSSSHFPGVSRIKKRKANV